VSGLGAGAANMLAGLKGKSTATPPPPASVTPDMVSALKGQSGPPEGDAPAADLPVSLAHSIDTLGQSIAHASSHVQAAAESLGDGDALKYNLAHAQGHMSDAVDQHASVAGKAAVLHPEIGDELAKIHAADGDPKVPSPAPIDATTGDDDDAA
jgi:hypothetical protein